MKLLLWSLTAALVAALIFPAVAFAAPALDEVLDGISAGDLAPLKKYKSQKGDLNAQNATGITPLMQAAATGQRNISKYLLQQKVNLEIKNENGDTALAMAIGNEHDDLALNLIEAGAKLDVINPEDGTNLVYSAASVNSKKALAYLLEKDPAQANAKNKNGDTALHEAARYGSIATLKTLIKAGAKKDIKNLAGKTPLDLAKELKNTEAQQLLK